MSKHTKDRRVRPTDQSTMRAVRAIIESSVRSSGIVGRKLRTLTRAIDDDDVSYIVRLLREARENGDLKDKLAVTRTFMGIVLDVFRLFRETPAMMLEILADSATADESKANGPAGDSQREFELRQKILARVRPRTYGGDVVAKMAEEVENAEVA